MKLKKLLGPDFDCPPEMSEVALTIRDLEFTAADLTEKYDDARSLLDGCYEIVELFNPETPSQVKWKQKWLEGARKHGASSL